VSIFAAIPWLSDNTCFLIYLMKASDDHLPINMIIYTGVPARNIPIAPPDPFEWVPISSAENPRVAFPSLDTACHKCKRIMDDGIRKPFPSNSTLSCVSLSFSGGISYLTICKIISIAARTGHISPLSTLSPEHW
jgi:hypothetical protein